MIKKLIRKLRERLTEKDYIEGYKRGFAQAEAGANLRALILRSMIEEEPQETKVSLNETIH